MRKWRDDLGFKEGVLVGVTLVVYVWVGITALKSTPPDPVTDTDRQVSWHDYAMRECSIRKVSERVMWDCPSGMYFTQPGGVPEDWGVPDER